MSIKSEMYASVICKYYMFFMCELSNKYHQVKAHEIIWFLQKIKITLLFIKKRVLF